MYILHNISRDIAKINTSLLLAIILIKNIQLRVGIIIIIIIIIIIMAFQSQPIELEYRMFCSNLLL